MKKFLSPIPFCPSWGGTRREKSDVHADDEGFALTDKKQKRREISESVNF